MIDTVIFDMDGLLFDTERIFSLAWDYAGEKCGIGPAGYMNLKTLGASLRASRDVWVAEFGDRYDEYALRRYSKEFLTDYYAHNSAPVKPGLRELLPYLKRRGYKLGVASSSPAWEVRHHLEEAGILSDFMAVVSGDMAAHTKPSPELYLIACELLGSAPGETIALEDSRNGLLSAFRAGCRPVMVPDLWQPDEETCTLLYARFERLDQLIPFLEALPPPR